MVFSVWTCEATGGKEDGEKAGGLVRVKRTETVLRGRLRDHSHILAL